MSVRGTSTSPAGVFWGGLARAALGALSLVAAGGASATPYTPASDTQIIAELPPGARHASTSTRDLARSRVDIALPLAQFYISQARATGDLRFLGYAEATLAPWMNQPAVLPQVLVLHATVLQSRHAFDAALAELDRALGAHPDDPQAWLTRATVLRVMGRYPQALQSCARLAPAADPAIQVLCTQGVQSLNGHLHSAYAAVASLPQQSMPPEARAWRYSELGEMAARLGDDRSAEHWFREGLQVAPGDFYIRAACADVLLRQGRAAETLVLLGGYESMEPMLLRATMAHALLRDGSGTESIASLANAFDLEQQRGDAVHRREQARFYLDVDPQPLAALRAARENWQVQREPDDILILLRAAHAAHQEQLAAPAAQFLQRYGLEDARLRGLGTVSR